MKSVDVSLSSSAQKNDITLSMEDQRRSNILKVIVSTTLIFMLAQIFYFSWTAENLEVVALLSVLVVWETSVLILNQRGQLVLARLLFLISAYPVLLLLPIYFGEASHFHYYLFPASGMALIFFKNEIGRWKWLLSLLAFPCWFYLEWHFAHFDGLFDLPIELLPEFQFYNETLVIITVTVMFAVFTRESDTQIEQIAVQNDQLVEFEASRTRSIQYASKIQRSLLPSAQKMEAIFPNSFVVYKPKDIIGGDFYWVKKIGSTRFIATADCTGHGVPGALLSMMIQSHLESIVVDDHQEVNDVLADLHQKVLASFKSGQNQFNSEDGCDISLVKVSNDNKLSFAGANTSLYYFNEQGVQILKGDLASIGGTNFLGKVDPNQTYKSHELDVRFETKVYLMSDGILDLMNANHEDFGSFQLKTMLQKLNQIDAFKSGAFIEKTLIEFQEKSEQLDDLLFIGFQVH